MCIILCLCPHLQMNAVRGGTVTWRPQPWQDGDGGGGEPLSDSDSEEEDFPDDSTTPLGDYITHGGTLEMTRLGFLYSCTTLGWSYLLLPLSHSSHLFLLCLSGLKQLLDAQQLCDVTLLVEGKKFMCHRYDCHMLQGMEMQGSNSLTISNYWQYWE